MAETATTTTETQVSEQTTGASEEKTPTVEELMAQLAIELAEK